MFCLSHSGNGQLNEQDSRIYSATLFTDDVVYGLCPPFFSQRGHIEIPAAIQALQSSALEHSVQFNVPTATKSHLVQTGTIL